MRRAVLLLPAFVLAVTASGCDLTKDTAAPTSPVPRTKTTRLAAEVTPSPTATGATGATGATEATEATGATEAPPPSPTTQVTLDYGADGVTVEQPADVSQLTGAPDEFKTFVAGLARQAQKAGQACPDAFHGITVQKLRGDFALGAVNDCGGYAALWARVDGEWREILGTQEQWSCADLAAHDVPEGFAGPCTG
jgi:hypothetical protein